MCDIYWCELIVDVLIVFIVEFDDVMLQVWYQVNVDCFICFEMCKIIYVWVMFEMLENSVQVDDQVLCDLYDSCKDEFQQFECCMVECLVFFIDVVVVEVKVCIDWVEVNFE